MILGLSIAALLLAVPEGAPEGAFTLKFRDNIPPEVTMDITNATVVEFEVPLKQDQVTTAKSRGLTLGEWLVLRGVCPDTDDACVFTVRFAGYVGTNPTTKKQEFYTRYIVRSEKGATAEGFSCVRSTDTERRSYWIHTKGFWVSVVGAEDQLRENKFLFMLLELARTGMGQKKAPATPKPAHTGVSAPAVV